MKIIEVQGESALVEITDRCYTGCIADYCYKKGIVSPKGKHLDLEVFKLRILWIKKSTNVKYPFL